MADTVSNVLAFPGGYNPRDIRGMAIEFAAKVDAGMYGNVKSAMIIFDTPDGLGFIQAGEATDGYRTIGMLQAAQMSVFADGDEE